MTDFSTWPKAELHVHLEGSVAPETLCRLDAGLTPETARQLYRISSFDEFIAAYKTVSMLLRGPADYAAITRALLAHLETQNVTYAEITISAGVVLWKRQDFGAVFDAIREGAAGSAVEVRWILDAVRHFGAEAARQVVELAAARIGEGVVAFGIGGDEQRGPASWFGEVFALAKSAGLHLTAHAGETAGAESIRDALRIGAERIGHGIRAVEDPELMRHLRAQDIPLEICITSNLATGVVRDLRAHPVRRLYDAGVPLTLNTDDPAMFATTLSAEYELAARHFGFSEEELRHIAQNGFRYAFDRSYHGGNG